jgi:long-chain acyl-CoA synthetase
MYGATENTARITRMPPEHLAARPDSVGLPIPGVRVELLDEAGAPVPVGEPGEVVVSGDSVASGYFQAPEETAVTFRGGKLHTGDLARMDAEGFLTIVDRLADFLKCGGTRTSCKAVEDVLVAFPEVVEAAVVGVPDDVLGEAVAAFVVALPGAGANVEQRLAEFARERLPVALQPKRWQWLPALPKSEAGKVLKPALRKLLG